MMLGLATDGIWQGFDARLLRIELDEIEVEVDGVIEVEVDVEES